MAAHLAVRAAKQKGAVYCPRLAKAEAEGATRPARVSEILDTYMEHAKRNRSYATILSRAPVLRFAFGESLASAITLESVMAWRDALHAEVLANGRTRSVTTVNHYVKLLRAVLGHAGITPNPLSKQDPVSRKALFLAEPAGRVRHLRRDEEARLLAALPARIGPVVRFALQTGLRREEILGLTWSMVDWDTATVHLATTKTGARTVLLNSAANDILRQQRAGPLRSVFAFPAAEGNRMRNFERDWRPALRAAQIENFRFHDLRHTWASRLAIATRDLYVVQKLGGWAAGDGAAVRPSLRGASPGGSREVRGAFAL